MKTASEMSPEELGDWVAEYVGYVHFSDDPKRPDEWEINRDGCRYISQRRPDFESSLDAIMPVIRGLSHDQLTSLYEYLGGHRDISAWGMFQVFVSLHAIDLCRALYAVLGEKENL